MMIQSTDMTILIAFYAYYKHYKNKQKKLTKKPNIYSQITSQNDLICSFLSDVLLRSLRPRLFYLPQEQQQQVQAKQLQQGGKNSSKVFKTTSVGNAEWKKKRTRNIGGGRIRRVNETILLFDKKDKKEKPLVSVNQSTHISDDSKEVFSLMTLNWYFFQDEKISKNNMIQTPVILILYNDNYYGDDIHAKSNMDMMIQTLTLKMKWTVVCLDKIHMIHSMECIKSDIEENQQKNIFRDMVKSNHIRFAVEKINSKLPKHQQNEQQPIIILSVGSTFTQVVKYLGEEGLNNTPRSNIAGAISISCRCDDESQSRPDHQSSQYISHISIPFLKLLSKEDLLYHTQNNRTKSNSSLYLHSKYNPNIITVTTESGSFANWQVSRKYGFAELWDFISSSSRRRNYHDINNNNWANRIVVKFITITINLWKRKKDYGSIENDGVPLFSKL